MSQTVITRIINAPADRVFETVAHIDQFSKAVPDIVRVELLSEQKRGAGTRFKETRLMKGREATAELEVTEYHPHDRVRFVSDEGGVVWDTVFTMSPSDEDGTQLTMVMDATPHKLLPKLLNPLMMGMVKKAIERDMDAVKTYCEAGPVPGEEHEAAEAGGEAHEGGTEGA